MNISPISQGMLKPDGTIDVGALQVLLNDIRNAVVSLWASGTTAQRPHDPVLGQQFYDTTLGATVVCKAIRAGATAAVWGLI